MAEPVITIVTQVGICAFIGYYQIKSLKQKQEKIICEKVRKFQNKLDTFDHSKIGNLINIVEMEIKNMPEISNLTVAEKWELIEFCKTLLMETDKETLEAAGIIINDKKYAKISNIYKYCVEELYFSKK